MLRHTSPSQGVGGHAKHKTADASQQPEVAAGCRERNFRQSAPLHEDGCSLEPLESVPGASDVDNLNAQPPRRPPVLVSERITQLTSVNSKKDGCG